MLIVGGEVGADVSEARAAEQGVDGSVDEHVAVAVSPEASVMRDYHASEHERARLDQRMDVDA